MHTALHPQANTDRLYIARNNGVGQKFSAEDCVETKRERLKKYVESIDYKIFL